MIKHLTLDGKDYTIYYNEAGKPISIMVLNRGNEKVSPHLRRVALRGPGGQKILQAADGL